MRWRDLLPGALRRSPVTAHLSLGSNVGDRDEHLRRAILALHRHEEIEVTAVSGVYETEPVGGVEQDRFLNAVVAVATTLAPHALLEVAQEVEAAEGRDREHELRWGPRPLDVDVLLFGDRTVDDDRLTIPHPRLAERAFVLVPLLEVDPGGRLPDGTRLSTLVSRIAPIEGIELAYRYTDLPGAGPRRPAGPRGPGAILADDWERPEGPPPGVER